MGRITILGVLICLGSGNLLGLNGSGTQGDPWLIESLADFNAFAGDPNYWDGYTRLETDIDLTGQSYSAAVIG